jgi:hypothetical protein
MARKIGGREPFYSDYGVEYLYNFILAKWSLCAWLTFIQEQIYPVSGCRFLYCSVTVLFICYLEEFIMLDTYNIVHRVHFNDQLVNYYITWSKRVLPISFSNFSFESFRIQHLKDKIFQFWIFSFPITLTTAIYNLTLNKYILM